MKKISLIAAAFLVAGVLAPLHAAEPANYQNFELDTLLHEIERPGEPIITEDYIIFTADVHNRHVGIVFDFENYKVIHPFEILTHTDDSGNVTRQHMFYTYKREHKFEKLRYRLIFDGLWTTDPMNPNRVYDDTVNLYFSELEMPNSIKIFTDAQQSDGVHFIYKGETGQTIHLAGTFTNWDPWIYELNETAPGLYELELPLPTGKYYYNYYIGLTPVIDSTNPNKVYAADGRAANVIVVD